ncbi:TetR/AcrR family transcriptional regulator [Candidatus Frankia nodulisporulans]|uniref:TetR/AcrR family transcriptional regulator n=1 Tax=Candidatus Frankia nodulisporulans TaxID=2060052 RepID=UPI001582E900|nr:TetR/AcrR family transcriptional regulator [Candidatus Frankia nodulisporulans]
MSRVGTAAKAAASPAVVRPVVARPPVAESGTQVERRAAGGTCRSKLNPPRLARAAIEIADAEGLAAVSMRRLATHLGVGTMTLYYHVRDKDELLDVMWDEFMGESLLAEVPADWRGGLTAIARRMRESYQRHPWTLQVIIRSSRGPNKLRFIEQYLGVVSRLTDDPLEQQRILHSVNDLVVGCTLREASVLQTTTAGWSDPTVDGQLLEPDFGTLDDGEELPRLRTLWRNGCLVMVPRFEQALGWLLDGIEAAHPDVREDEGKNTGNASGTCEQ